MLMPYEGLTTQPEKAFSDILSFLNIPMHTHLFHDALALCSREALAAIEAEMGRSMIGDQRGNGRHIRDGRIGQWREHFPVEEVQRVEAILNIFNISLEHFIITDASGDSLTRGWLKMDGNKKNSYQTEFFRQQHAWKNIQAIAA